MRKIGKYHSRLLIFAAALLFPLTSCNQVETLECMKEERLFESSPIRPANQRYYIVSLLLKTEPYQKEEVTWFGSNTLTVIRRFASGRVVIMLEQVSVPDAIRIAGNHFPDATIHNIVADRKLYPYEERPHE